MPAPKISSLKENKKIQIAKDSSLFHEAELTAAWKRKPENQDGSEFDVDLLVVLTDDSGDISDALDIIYYRNYVHRSLSVVHHGDDKEGSEDGVTPSEIVTLKLDEVPAKFTKLHIFLSLHRAKERRQSLSMIEHGQICLTGNADGEQIKAEFDSFTEGSTNLKFGVLERSGDGWSFERDTLYFPGFVELIASVGCEAE